MNNIILTIGIAGALLVFQTSIAGCNNASVKVPQNTPGYMVANEEAINSMHSGISLKEKTGLLFMYAGNADTLWQANSLTEEISGHHIGSVYFTGGTRKAVSSVTQKLNKDRRIPYLFGIQGVSRKFIGMEDLQEITRSNILGSVTESGVYRMLSQVYGRIMHKHNLNLLMRPAFFKNQEKTSELSDKLHDISIYNFMQFWKNWQKHHLLAAPVVNYHDGRNNANSVDFKFDKSQVSALVNTGLGAVVRNPSDMVKRGEVNFFYWLDSIDYKGVVFNSRMMHEQWSTDDIVEDLMRGYDVFVGRDSVFSVQEQLLQRARRDSALRSVINQKSRKILKIIYWSQNAHKQDNSTHFEADKQFAVMREILAEHAMILIEDEKETLPVKEIANKDIASLSISAGQEQHFQRMLNRYKRVPSYTVHYGATRETFLMMQTHLKKYDQVIMSLHPPKKANGGYASLNSRVRDFIERIGYLNNISLFVFAEPQYLTRLSGITHPDALVITHGNDSIRQNKAAQLVFGGIMPHGKLAENIDMRLQAGAGKVMNSRPCRLGYASARAVGIKGDTLKEIEKLVQKAIKRRMMPGCRIIAARKGKVFYNKSFGYHTYKQKNPVEEGTIYDLASLTKVAATTLALMHKYDQGKFELNDPLSKFIPALDSTNKKRIEFQDVMGHQARLAGWLPFYFNAYDNYHKQTLRDDLFRSSPEPGYTCKVADNLYVLNTFRDTIMNAIYNSRLKAFKRYKYSDLGFYLLHKAFDGMAEKSMDAYLDSVFYKPMGANELTFNPLKKFDNSRIPPTENDTYFRKQQIDGYVQDRGAALLGGVSGHAGLFGSAEPLAALLQMLLNKGMYGCKQFIKPTTLELFTSNPFFRKKNHRGLGFDKPAVKQKNSSACKAASEKSFGHLGFTGTMIWADPKHELVYVFLSNRVYPSIKSNKLAHSGLRQRIQQVFYEAITKPYYQPAKNLHQSKYNEQEKSL